MDDVTLRAVAAGLAVALAAAPLGCFVVWRRMAYFGATLAHAALLGVALGMLLGIDATLGIAAVAIAVALIVTLFERQRLIGNDTLLGILAHSSLAIGLVALAFMEGSGIGDTGAGATGEGLLDALFGDVLSVTGVEIAWMAGGGLFVLIVLAVIWRPLLAITVNEELARAEGLRVMPVQLAFMLIIAVVIAIAMKVVGVLLIVSLLIIPAATARRFARTPEQMGKSVV